MGASVETTPNLVGGQWVLAGDGEVADRHDPADTSRLVVRSPVMGPEDVAAALDHADAATRTWARTSVLDRGAVLLRAATSLRERADEIALDITRENGKTLAEARVEVTFAAASLEHHGGLARATAGQVLADRRTATHTWYEAEPLGVVLLITPWNDPLATPVRKLGAALLAGNTVVMKPGSETPRSAYHLARALHDAGLPAGVLNVVTGRSAVVAPVLLGDPRVRAVSFTGSTDVGLDISRSLAGTTTRLQAEMGGKNAAAVLSDADLELAAGIIAGSACGQSGQRCTATSRVVVATAVADRFLELLAGRLEAVRVGPGDEPEVTMGPLATEEQLRGVLDAVDTATAGGQPVVLGGRQLTDEGRERGYFVAPSLFRDVDIDSALWREEIFGPVLAVTTADDLDEAIRLVDDSRYGLTSSVFTRDLGAAHRFASEVETGQVAVNLPSGGWDLHMPFGGFKDSGSPFKENGAEGLRFYTRTKTVAMAFG